jgi:hypothetical protein
MAKLSIRPSDTVEAIFRLILAALCVISCPNVGEANVAITTYHYDNLRTGWNSSETNLAEVPILFRVDKTELVEALITKRLITFFVGLKF